MSDAFLTPPCENDFSVTGRSEHDRLLRRLLAEVAVRAFLFPILSLVQRESAAAHFPRAPSRPRTIA